MKTIDFILVIVPQALESGSSGNMNSAGWYSAVVLIALLLIGYLIFSLIKPEKF